MAILFHCHIFKNAGSTVEFLLDKNFADEHGRIESAGFDQLTKQQLTSALDANRHWKALSTHTAGLQLPKYREPLIPLVFLRHPVDRIHSIYCYEKQRTDEENIRNPSAYIAKDHDFRGFVEWGLDRMNTYGIIIRNFQTWQICGQDSYWKAIRLLIKAPCVGIVEEFEQSLNLFKPCLERHFGEFDTEYEIQNRSPDRPADLAERLDVIKELLGPSLYRKLESHNDLDFRLWHFAARLLRIRRRSLEIQQYFRSKWAGSEGSKGSE